MNKNIYRVIFNAVRSLWTVVQETATGGRKGRLAGTTRRAPLIGGQVGFMLSMRHVAFAALCVLGMQPVWVDAQVVAAPASGSRPIVGVTANGLPIIQIATPNAAGVSNNAYTQYNVGSQGQILNNSATSVQTQLGGYVTGNPNLASGSARVIVNQVVGGNASQLLGYTEVAGQKAEVVIANPAGIYCNGCGFINTSRGILTTGTPVFGGTGSLDAFHVTGGQIQIGTAGFNGSDLDQVDLIARAVAVNGKIWAGQSLNVVTGNNDVRHSDLNAQSLGPDGNSPGVAIDVAQLGGMYAGKIMLVGTEKGVGVNSVGTIAAQAGDLQLSSEGKVTLSGSTSANGNVVIAAAGDVLNSGSVYATQSTTLNSQGQVGNSGTIASLGNTTITGASVNSTGSLGAGIDANGNVTGTGNLTGTGNVAVTGSGAVTAAGRQMAGGNLALSGSSLNMAGGQTLAQGNASLTATGTGGDTGNIVHTGATLQVNGSLTANAAGSFTNDQGQISAAQLSVTAGGISNRSGTLSQTGTGVTTLAASGVFDNTGGTVTTNTQNTTIRSGSLTNANGTISQAGTAALNIQTGALDNSHGTIGTNGVATIAATTLRNGSGSITSAQALNVASTGDIDNTAGRLEAAGAVDVSGANVQNTAGRIVSGNDDGIVLTASGQITNAAGTTAQGATGGVIGGNGNATINAASLANSGTLTAAQNLDVTTSGSLDNSGGSMSGATLEANAASLKNANGTISANTVWLTAPQFDNSSGKITANQFTVSATNLTNEGGSITQLGSGAMDLGVSGALDNSNGGAIQTNSTDLTLASASVNNDGGTITHAGTGTLTIAPATGTGSLSNVGGKIVTNGQASVTVGNLDNTGGTLAAQGVMTASVQGTLNNTNGRLSSGTGLTASSGGELINTGGVIGAGGAATGSTLSLSASSLDNSGGAITNVGDGATTINAGSQLINSNAGSASGMGAISGNGDVTLNATLISNTQGGQLSGANLQINTGNLDNTGGAIGNVANATGDVGITTGTLTATSGQINALRNLSVTANTLAGGGTYSAVNDLSLNLQGNFTTSPNYRFNAGHNLTFTLPGTFSNGGALSAVNGLDINASDIENTGALVAGGLLATHSNMLTNTGTIVGGSVSLNATQTLSNLGTSALIGATDSAGTLELLAPDIENRDDTTATDTQATTAIYGLGKVVLAGGKDAGGNYTRANLIHNQSALIQSTGDMTVDANQVTNTRRVMTTSGLTSSVDPALLESLGISMSGCTAINMAACSGQDVGWVVAGDPTMIGGAFTVPPHGGEWNSGYQYTTYTGAAVASTVASISPEAQILAGGNLNASSVGTFQNYWSQVAATGNIAAPATIDQNSWQGQDAPKVQVTYSGEYHYNNYDNSEHDWQLPFGDAPFVGSNPGGYTQAAPADIRTYALPGYESTFTSGGTLSGTGVTINNTAGNAGVTPLGLLPGQTVSGTVAVQGGQILNSGLANFNNPTIAAATAVKVLNNITVPKGGLFSPDTAPNAPYLVETNPAFTNQQQWLSSDYYFQQMGMNSDQIQMRLGDGFYEQKLVQDQILSMTGKSVLTNYADTQAEFQALMTSGAQLAESLDLAPGTALSPEQVAQLTSNVVIMQTQIVDGESVLVPVVYLAQVSQENMNNGPVIAATNIDLQNAQSVTNSGTIKAADSFAIGAQSIDSSFGTLQSGGQMTLVTVGDVDLTSATLNAGSLALQAGGDLVLDTAANTLSQVSDTGATRVTTTLGPQASINVTGDAVIGTGGNFEQNAGALSVGGNLGMQIGGDWTLGAQQTGEHKVVERANGVSDTDINQVVGSSVKVGGQSNVAISGDLTARGAQIDLGEGGTIAAKGNVSLGTASATSTVNSNSSDDQGSRSYAETLHMSDQALTGTTLQGGDTVNIVSGKDITISGSTISLDKGNANLLATGDVNIGAASETHELNSHETHSHDVVVSGSHVASGIDQTMTLSQGSTISADGIEIVSGQDINVTGSNIVGTNDVTLNAAHDVNITTSQDTQATQTDYSKSEYGFLSGITALNQLDGGLQGYSFGTRKTTDDQQSTQVTNNGSMIGSVSGNLTVTAGDDLHVTGSTVYAANDLGLAGKTVTIDAAQNTSTQNEQHSLSQTAISAGISNPILAAVQTANQMRQDAKEAKGDARLEALAAATAGLAVKNAIDAVASNPTSVGGIGVNVSLGTSHSSNNSTASSSTAVGSTVSAGHNLSIAAAGAGADSNISVIGSDISAGNNATLNAEGNINLQAGQNSDSQTSTNGGSSASIGVTIGVGAQNGISFQAGVSATKGNGNGSDTTWTNTHVNAGNTLTLQSGGDTNLKGAVVGGQQVVANVGGDLNVESLQDVTHYDSKQTSGGVSVSVCVPPICIGASSASADFSQQNMDSDYASVVEQSGIKAGDGGFQINVQGNTDFKGAVIASSDKAVQDGANSLTTATLTHSDIENQAAYDASSVGMSGGYGGTIGKNQQGTASNTNPVGGTDLPSYHGFTATPPAAIGASGDASSTTGSAISGGVITITDGTKQQQLTGQTAAEAVAGISHDTSSTANTIAPIFDKDKIEVGFDITSQFINQVGTFVNNRAKEADAAKAAANNVNLNPEQRAQAQQQADQLTAEWGPGGSYRQVLTALTAAASGNVTGGGAQFVQAGLVNYLQQQGAGLIGKLVADGTITEGSPLHAALHAIIGCAAAAASDQSCGAGAMGAATASLLTNLFTDTDPNETEQQKQAKEDLVDTLVAGIATVTGSSSVAVTVNAAQAEVENNWLATQQIVQAKKELNACGNDVLCQFKTVAKWGGVSVRQDWLTTTGVGKGLAQAGFSDLQGMAQFLSHPIVGLNGLSQLLSTPDIASALGDQIVESLRGKISDMQTALNVGGDTNAELLGRDLGNLVWQVGSVVTAAEGIAKAGVELGTVGIKLSGDVLKGLSESSDATQATATIINNFYRDGASPALIQQTFERAALSSTHNANSSEVVLGKYIAGSADSYDAVAQAQGVTYFSMSDWSTVQSQLGGDQMWNINKAFLDQQIAQGKTFLFTANPASATVGSYTNLEYQYLRSSGYNMVPDSGGYYRAVKK